MAAAENDRGEQTENVRILPIITKIQETWLRIKVKTYSCFCTSMMCKVYLHGQYLFPLIFNIKIGDNMVIRGVNHYLLQKIKIEDKVCYSENITSKHNLIICQYCMIYFQSKLKMFGVYYFIWIWII